MAPGITQWADKSGDFKRQTSSFRDWISPDENAKYPPEKGRYHLYVSYACPWATRALIARKLKNLEEIITFSSVHWLLGDEGWRFPTPEDQDAAGDQVIPDPLHGKGFTHIRQIYFESDPDYNARFTVPVLYDKKTRRIVNNESADILRMLGSAFDGVVSGAAGGGGEEEKHQRRSAVVLYPESLRAEIDRWNEDHYDKINNGVYKAGFATTQEAYEKNVVPLFEALDRSEAHLKSQAEKGMGLFWFGKEITEVDIRLFVTIIRFDVVYVSHFRCDLTTIRSGYPYLHKWLRNLYWNVPAFKDTTNFLHIKNHYTKSHKQINPPSITPLGPVPHILGLDEEVRAVEVGRI